MRIFIELFTVLLSASIVGLWTYAWLLWCFKATVRHWLVMLMPARWKEGKSDAAIHSMSSGTFNSYMNVDFRGPAWLGALLTCRYCLSAHIALVGTLLLLCLHLSLVSAILAWAGGAGAANYFYKD